MQKLPIDGSLKEIHQAFVSSQNIVITATPGSGKTTRVPPAALNWVSGQILILEPRRVAALAAASRIAEENNWTLGQEVGYQVRFENKTTAATRLKFLTEALLVRQMISDPELKNVDLIILDEFHERSSNVDLALGLLRELQLMGHKIKLIVMSATLEAEKISAYLGNAPICSVPGQLFELTTVNDSKPQLLRTTADFFDRVAAAIKQASAKTKHDTLVFLPGVGEIHRVESLLSPWAENSKTLIQTLYAQKPLEEQKRILKKSDQKRIILSTNIAESALTLDGVGLVIDTGLEKRVEFDSKTENEKISLQRISLASAKQRAGRAARQFPGQCLRLWTKSDELSFPSQIPAEILKIDLSPSLLFLAAQGVRDFIQFGWYEAPPKKMIEWAQSELRKLELVTNLNEVTALGKSVLNFPVSPRLGKMLVMAEQSQVFQQACELVALLQEKDILTRTPEHLNGPIECDLLDRWALWKESSSLIHRKNLESVQRVAEQLQKFRSKSSTVSQKEIPWEKLHKLIVDCYIDRLCIRRQSGSDRALRRSGRGVLVGSESIVKKSTFFVPLKGMDMEGKNETQISWACGVSENLILKWYGSFLKKSSRIEFDPDRNRLIRITQTSLFDLPIDTPVVTQPEPKEIAEHLPEVIFSCWPELIRKNEYLKRWNARYEYIQSTSKSSNWTLDEGTLKPICEELAMGRKSLAELEEINLVSVIESHMPAEIRNIWNKEWPFAWQAPGGRIVPIQYELGQNPFIEIKIQEIFGLSRHPKMFGEEIPLVFHLLAPSQRPVQVTSDIPGFWKGSYQEVRKELKPRYPKHSWPEDPQNADPEPPKFRRH